jgi:hypothetical protein
MKKLLHFATRGLGLGLIPLLSTSLHAQTITWVGGSTGSWHVGTNWATGNTPSAGADVEVGTGASIAYTTGSSPLLNSVNLARRLELSGGTLSIASALNLNAGGSLYVNGGTLTGATVNNSSLVTFADASNVFDAVTLAAGQPLSVGSINSTGRLTVKNGLSYSNGQVFHLGQYSKLYFDAANTTLDNATVNNLDNSYYTYLGVNGNNQILTIGPNLVLNATKYLSFNDQGYTGTTLVNNNNLSSRQGGDWLLELKNIRNNSVIEASGSSSTITFGPNALLNNQPGGEVRALNGGGVTIHDATSLGKVRATDAGSIVNLAGNYTTADLSDAKSLNNGIISINNAGVVNNTGATLNVSNINSNNSGKIQLNGGKIVGGTLQNSEQLKFTNANNILDNVTLSPGQGLNIGSANNPGKVIVKNGIGFSNNPSITLADKSSLYFDGANSLLDNVTLNKFGAVRTSDVIPNIGGNIGVSGNNQTLTIGQNSVINNQSILLFDNQGYSSTTLINNGSISSKSAENQYFSRTDIKFSNFINNGLVAGTYGDVNLSPSTVLDNRPGGEIRSDFGTVTLYDAVNLGKIRASGANGKISLSGNYTTAQLSDVKPLNGGTISIAQGGTIDNTGATLNVLDINNNNNGKFRLEGGKIVGGTLQNSQQLDLSGDRNGFIGGLNGSGILDGVTLAPGQGLNLSSGGIGIQNGLNYSENPTFDFGNGGTLFFDDPNAALDNAAIKGRTLSNSEGTYYSTATLSVSDNKTLTLGSNLKYENAYVSLAAGENATIVNNSVLPQVSYFATNSFINNNTLNIKNNKFTSVFATSGNFINNGEFNIEKGSLLYFEYRGSIFRQNAGHLTLNGGLNVANTQNYAFFSGGLVSGTGGVGGYVYNDGAVVAPGNNPESPIGKLSVYYDYVQTTLGTLEIDIAGFSKGEFDVLYTHAANIDGLLKLNLNYTPEDGQEFPIIGTFADGFTTNESGVFGNFARIEVNDPNYTASFSAVNKQGVVKLSRNVPEPGTLVLILFGLGAFAGRFRHAARRRSTK